MQLSIPKSIHEKYVDRYVKYMKEHVKEDISYSDAQNELMELVELYVACITSEISQVNAIE